MVLVDAALDNVEDPCPLGVTPEAFCSYPSFALAHTQSFEHPSFALTHTQSFEVQIAIPGLIFGLCRVGEAAFGRCCGKVVSSGFFFCETVILHPTISMLY